MPVTFQNAAEAMARNVVLRLEERKSDRVVFAESCTAGMVAATMGQVPGVSNWLCGSAVTYRESVKQAWISVSEKTLKQHSAESLETTIQMALGVLRKTVEATFSAAVTGHLGPGAAKDIDGVFHVAVATRDGDEAKVLSADSFKLESTTRVDRQHEATHQVLETVLFHLGSSV